MARKGRTETSCITEDENFKAFVEMEKMLRKLQVQLSRALEAGEEKDRVIAKMATQIESLNDQILKLSEQLSLMSLQLYGTGPDRSGRGSSEKKTKPGKEDHNDDDSQTPAGGSNRKITRPVKPEKTKKERRPKATLKERIEALGLTPEVQLHDLSQDQKTCTVCGTELKEIGSHHISYELIYVPGTVKVIEHRGKTFGCPACKEEARKPETALENLNLAPVSAQAPAAILNRSWASASLISWIIMMKVMFQMPVTRLCSVLRSMGSLVPSPATLCGWLIQVSRIYFLPLFEKMKEILVQRDHLQADETPLQVINESFSRKKSKSFMWQFRTVENDEFPIVLFNYTHTRGGYHAAKFLSGFKGTLLVDGFTGYNRVECDTLAYCRVHARRYFIEAGAASRNEAVQDAAREAVERIELIFAHEECMKEKNLSLKEQLEYRQGKVIPVVDDLFEWAEQYPYEQAASEKLRKAFVYLLNHKAGLKVFLSDPYVPAHNNRSEQSFVSFARGRNNWLFAYSEEGAGALGILFSIVKTAEANGLNIYRYLTHILETFRGYQDSGIPETVLESVCPWNGTMKTMFGMA